MTDPLGFLSIIKGPLMDLYKWVTNQLEIKRAKERFFRAIKDETDNLLSFALL